MKRNANIDLCGIRNLLSVLEQSGFSRQELRRILARIAAQTGADIIFIAEEGGGPVQLAAEDAEKIVGIFRRFTWKFGSGCGIVCS